jgi:hypothetical protein
MHTELYGHSRLRGRVSNSNLQRREADIPVQRITLPLMVSDGAVDRL